MTERLEIGDGWFRLHDDRVDLRRRPVVRRLFDALVERRREAPGDAMDRDAIREAAWPGEKMSPETASRRVYLAIHTLRKLGVDDALETTENGWRLTPTLPLVRMSSGRCEPCPSKGEPAHDGGQPCDGVGNGAGEA